MKVVKHQNQFGALQRDHSKTIGLERLEFSEFSLHLSTQELGLSVLSDGKVNSIMW